MLALHDSPGHLARRLHQISTSIFADHMARLGEDITPVQYACLVALVDYPGLDQASLSGLVAHDRVTIGGAVDRLVAKGLVQRKISHRDRRARVLTLSPEGRELLYRIEPGVQLMQSELLDGLTDKERATFLRLLHKAVVAGNARSRAPLHLPEIPADPASDASSSATDGDG